MCKVITAKISVAFFTILNNLLTVGASARGKEQARCPQPHPGGLLEEAVGGYENSPMMTLPRCSSGDESSARSEQRSPATILRKAKNTKWPI